MQKRSDTRFLLTVLASLLLLSVIVSRLQAELEFEKRSVGILGEIFIPVDWSSEVLASDKIRYTSFDGLSSIELQQLELGSMREMSLYLQNVAKQLSLPVFVRGFDRDLLDEVNADNGGFVLGTVVDSLVLNRTRAGESQDTSKSTLDQKEKMINGKEEVIPPPNSASAYHMIIIYKKNTSFFQLKGYSSDLPGGSNLLYKIHRSWRLK